MQHTFRLGCLLALVGIAVLGAACGRTAGLPATQQAGASSSATPGASSQVVSGQVTLTLDRQQYTAGDIITVTIHNGLSQTIWTVDHQTNCTVVTAEHLQDGHWLAVGDCRLMTPTLLVPLPDHSATTAQLAVPSASSSSGSGWPTGTYHVTFTYNGGDEGSPSPGGTSGIAHSAEFTLR
jgi:hypothetical protein